MTVGADDEKSSAPREVQLADLRQGDVLALPSIPVAAAGGPVHIETPDGVVVISQTCDIVRDKPETISVAPLRHLSPQAAGNARRGKSANLVHMPNIGDQTFVDLSVIGSCTKDQVKQTTVSHTFSTADDVFRFGRHVGRKFSRFAVPDELHLWFAPLSELAYNKLGRTNDAERKAFDQVVTILLEPNNDSWEYPHELTLLFVLPAGSLPSFDGDEPPPPLSAEMATKLARNDAKSSGKLAELLDTASMSDKAHIWPMVADAWAQKCFPSSKDLAKIAANDPDFAERTATALSSGEIQAEVLTTEELTYARSLRSPALDLEYLSPIPEALRQPGRRLFRPGKPTPPAHRFAKRWKDFTTAFIRLVKPR